MWNLFFVSPFYAELISPEDLLQACSLWEKFDVYVLIIRKKKKKKFYVYA